MRRRKKRLFQTILFSLRWRILRLHHHSTVFDWIWSSLKSIYREKNSFSSENNRWWCLMRMEFFEKKKSSMMFCLMECVEVMMVNRFNMNILLMCKEDKLSSLERNKNNNNIIKTNERERSVVLSMMVKHSEASRSIF